MKKRLELKPGSSPKPNPQLNPSVEKLNRFLKNLRFFFGLRPELELSREDLNPSQSLNDVRKKTSLNPDNQLDNENEPNAFAQFVEGAMDFLSAFSMIMAGDLSYDPDAAPAPEPAPQNNPQQKNAQQKKPDPLAWKKRIKPPQLSQAANRHSFAKQMNPQPRPAPAIQNTPSPLIYRRPRPMPFPT